MEVPEVKEKADAVAERLTYLLPEARIRRPEQCGEVRLFGFDETVLPAELVGALAGLGV